MIFLMQVISEPPVSGGTGRVTFKSHQASGCTAGEMHLSTQLLLPSTDQHNALGPGGQRQGTSCYTGRAVTLLWEPKGYKTNQISPRSKTVPPYPVGSEAHVKCSLMEIFQCLFPWKPRFKHSLSNRQGPLLSVIVPNYVYLKTIV